MADNIQWSDELRIDNGALDAQHKWLFNLAGRLDDLSFDFEEISKFVLQLYQYMETHFEKEENMAKRVMFPKCDEMAHAHQSMIDKMNAMMKTCKSIDELRPQIHEIFSAWMTQHILTLDKELALHIKKRLTIEE